MSIFPSINTGGIKRAGAAALKGISQASSLEKQYTGLANDQLTQGKTEGLGYLDTGAANANKYYDKASALYNGLIGQDQSAWNTYRGSLGLGTPEDRAAAVGAFQNSPGYQAALDQAQQGVLRHFADTGGVANGGVLRALQTVAQNAQNQDYGNWQSQLASNFNPLNPINAQSNVYGNQAAAANNVGANKADLTGQTAGHIATNYTNLGANLAGLAHDSGMQNANTLNSINNAKYQNSQNQWSDALGLLSGGLSLGKSLFG